MRFIRHLVASVCVLFAASCTYQPGADLTCESGESAPGQQCVEGVWVPDETAGDTDLIPDMNDSDPDVGDPDMGCTPETDDELCAASEATCGMINAMDSCGASRQITCGDCTDPEVCQADNTCFCDPQTDRQLCDAASKDCGMYTGPDNCGDERTVDCGACEAGIECGEQSPNVCGCPCLIDGECRPEGSANPDNPCQTCQPSVSETEWSIDEGRSCDDGDMCTENDVCDASGMCAGSAKDCSCGVGNNCSGVDQDCHVGMCDSANGNCVAMPVADDTPCPDDGTSCTVDSCQAGQCLHNTIEATSCLVGGTCYGDGEEVDGCRVCDPQTSQVVGTIEVSKACNDQDGLTCTSGSCNAAGACVPDVDTGACAIAGACYAADDTSSGNDCQACKPATSQTSFTDLNSGSCSDGFACTSGDTCSGGQCQSGSIDANSCLINQTCYSDGDALSGGSFCLECDASQNQTDFSIVAGTCRIGSSCFSDGDPNPSNPCEVCDADADPNDWTALDGDNCGAGCSCNVGVCERNNGGAC